MNHLNNLFDSGNGWVSSNFKLINLKSITGFPYNCTGLAGQKYFVIHNTVNFSHRAVQYDSKY